MALKAEGVVAGIPDLFLAVPRGDRSGLFIEMKAGKGVLTDSQKEAIRQLTMQGYRCEVIRSVDEFQAKVNEYMNSGENYTN
jgi:hypothetical protein